MTDWMMMRTLFGIFVEWKSYFMEIIRVNKAWAIVVEHIKYWAIKQNIKMVIWLVLETICIMESY